MKVMSIILALLLLVSAVTAFATGPYYGADTAEFVINGDNATATVTPLTKQAGKSNDDYAYRLSGGTASASVNYIQMAGIKSNSSKLECQFMLKDDSSAIRFNIMLYNTSAQSSSARTSNDRIDISTSGIVGRSGYTTVNLADHTIEKNKWYTLAIVYEYGSTTNKKIGDLYLNGINLGTINSNNVAYSMAYTRLGCGSSTSEIYLDNLYTYSGEFSPEKLTPSYVTSVTGGAVEDDVITVPYGTKVSEISSILTTDDGNSDIVRIYTDSSMTTEADPTASANGTTLVVAATNGATKEMAYSYYTVEEPDPDADVLKGNNTADLSIADNTDYAAGGTDAEIELESGVYGKALDDSAYKFEKTNSKAYINYSCGHKADTHSLLEFGFARKDTEDSFRLEMNYYTDSNQSSRTSITMYFRDGGIQWGDSVTTLYGHPFDVQKWYTVAVQFPTNGDEDILVYVNGDLIYTGGIADGAYGLGYARFKIAQGNTFYLDNIRKAQELYTPSKDAKAEISVANGVVKDNALKMLAADETKITIGETDILRMYKSDWSTAANLSEADFVVAAAKNGRNIERTYTYLDKEIASVIVDYSKAIQEDETTLNAKLMANEGASTLIVAWYDDKELVDLEVKPAVAADGIYVAENNLTLNNSYSYRIFAWNSVDGLYPLTKATDIK